MFRDFLRNYIYPIATMAGSIIGVGFLALPYLALQVGIMPMLFYFVVLTAVITYLHVMFGTVALHTPDSKRFPGFVGFYFGRPMELFTLLLMIVGAYGVLLVYIIIGWDFLTTLLNLQNVSWPAHLNFHNLFLPAQQTGVKAALLVFGPILFSLWGTGMIPDVEEQVRSDKKLLYKSIIVGTCIPAVLYVLFMVIVLAITGAATTPSALVGWSVILGLITVSIAFVVQGNILREILIYDLGISRPVALGAAFLPPVALFIFGITQFIPVISFIGTCLLPLNALLIILMYIKVKSI